MQEGWSPWDDQGVTPEFRERAVRLVREWQAERGLSDGGVTAIAAQLGLHRETLRRWMLEQEVEAGERRGLTRGERSRIAELGAGES